MRRLAGVLLLVALAVRPAAGGSMLIATDASQGRLDTFCLRSQDGAFAAETPRTLATLAGPNPRRILFVPEERPERDEAGVVYVAEPDRVEAFRIGGNGTVADNCADRTRCRSRTTVDIGTEARGLAVSADHGTLYVAERGFDRIAAYALDGDGLFIAPEGEGADPTSCVLGTAGSGYSEVVVSDGLLYASAEVGRVDVYQTLADGSLCKGSPCVATTPADECPAHPKSDQVVSRTPPFRERRALFDPTSLFVIEGMLYVQEASIHRLAGFRIDELQPPPPKVCFGETKRGSSCTAAADCAPDSVCSTARVCRGGENAGMPCTKATECPGSTCRIPRECTTGTNLGGSCTVATEATDCGGKKTCGFQAPKRATRTDIVVRYADMEVAGSTLIGSQFFRGRVDTFRLQEAGKEKLRCSLTACPAGNAQCCLPRQQSGQSKEDLRMSPVGLAVASLPGGMVLYVAAGEDDRIRAYRLYPNGLLQDFDTFSETAAQADSFPNDVAVAVLKSGCR